MPALTAKRGKKRMAIVIIAVAAAAALAVGGCFAARYALRLAEYKKRIAAISVSDVPLSDIPDGAYTGSYDAVMIAATVRVHVTGHRIVAIELLAHKNERGKKAEAVLGEVQVAQSLRVDTVTGATNSSKVILKAVQNALLAGTARG